MAKLGQMDHQKSLGIYNLQIIVMRCDVMYWNYVKSSFLAALIGQLYLITWSFAESYGRAMSEQLKNDVLKAPS